MHDITRMMHTIKPLDYIAQGGSFQKAKIQGGFKNDVQKYQKKSLVNWENRPIFALAKRKWRDSSVG